MATVKETVLLKSLLPQTGVFTMKDHLLSFESSFIAEGIGTVEVSGTEEVNLIIQPDKENIVITPSTQEIEIDSFTESIEVELGAKDIEVDLDC